MDGLYKAVTKFNNEIVAIPVEVDDAHNYENYISLHKAALIGNTQIVEILLKAGANINEVNWEKNTPLHCAVTEGHAEIVKMLLKAGANINAGDSDEETPLHEAARKGHTQIVEILLQAGANVNALNRQKYTPLHLAVRTGNAEIVKMLLKAGANINALNWLKSTPLHCAATYGHAEIVKMLLKAGANINAGDSDEETPLHKAAWKGHTEIVEILLEAGANVNAGSWDEETPLHKAAKKGHTQIVEILLEAGANVNALNQEKYTPLHCAVTKGHAEIVKMLLKAGANINAGDSGEETPLHEAAWNGHTEIIEILLQAGANVNAQNEHKLTPLHYAAAEGYKEIVEILLDAGARCNAECTDRHTPLYYSDEKGHTEVSEYLREHRATTGQGVWQRLFRNISSTFFTRTLSHTQTTKIVHVRSESTGAASRQTDHRETTVVSSESWDIQDLPHCDRRSESTTPCSSDSTGNTSSNINDSQQSATSDQSMGLSPQEGEDIRQQVADHWAKFSLQHNGQQGHCSTDVTSVVKEGNITLINSPVVTINFINKTVHNYQQESLQITHANIVSTGDQQHGERRSKSTTPCSSDSTGNNPSSFNDSQPSATSHLSPGLSLNFEDFGQRVADLYTQVSDKRICQQCHRSTEGNITVIVNVKPTINHNYPQGPQHINNPNLVNMYGTVNFVEKEDVDSDSKTEESDECWSQ